MTIDFLGDKHEIIYKYYPGKEARIFRDEAKNFCIYINNNWDNERQREEIKGAIKRWLIKEARNVINERLEHYKNVIGVAYNEIRIKGQKTRWGSCSSKRNLNFNYKLIMAPLWVVDYVVIHELCHLRHMNHSREFWETVSCYCKDFKEAKQWLKENGNSLFIDYKDE